MSPELLFFLIFAAVAIGSAIAMLLAKNAVYSAIFLIFNFSTIALFYLFLHAPFIAMVQITVYAGAIMVLFLFVIMLIGGEETPGRRDLPWQRPLSIFMGALLVGGLVFMLLARAEEALPGPAPDLAFGSPTQIGLILYSEYVLPFQLTGILLLIAMIGAIIISHFERKHRTAQAEAMRQSAERARAAGDGRGETPVVEDYKSTSIADTTPREKP
jgi:NADH-quinone oxidoreductase subunit J